MLSKIDIYAVIAGISIGIICKEVLMLEGFYLYSVSILLVISAGIIIANNVGDKDAK